VALSGWAASRGPERAHRFLSVNDPIAAARIPVANLKYTLRALEILLSTGAPASAREPEGDRWLRRFRTVRVALRPARAQLHARIEDRVRRMLDSGWDAEVRRLLERGLSGDSNSFQAIGYREVAQWVLGRSSRKEAEEKIVAATRGLAKRQTTWLARERELCELTPENALAETLALLDEGRETR
jgi:tRNA dimethylallyltransferase